MNRYPHRIVVEGMDGAGKTVLVEELAKRFDGAFIIRNPKGPDQEFNTWWTDILDQEAIPDLFPIHDRFFYSELAYGPTLRGSLSADPAVIANVSWFLRSTSILVYARPDSDHLRRGFKTYLQMEGVESKFIQLLELYDQIMESEKTWYGSRFIHYVWHRENEFDRVAEIVKEYLKDALR